MPPPEYIEAIILGIVQGIAEFLPISSSGHLVIAGELLQQLFPSRSASQENFLLTVALHVGTLFSILVVYRNELKTMLSQRNILQAIVVATLPLVAIGICLTLNEPLKAKLDSLFSSAMVAGCGLLATATILTIGRRLERGNGELNQVTSRQAIAVGLFQAMAIVPGISRSGSTIAGGLIGGMRREAATAFSFFIAIPAIAGGGTLAAKEVWEGNSGSTSIGALLVGAAVAFAVGWVALHWLIRLVSQKRLHWFAWYCAFAGTATIIWQLSKRIMATS